MPTSSAANRATLRKLWLLAITFVTVAQAHSQAPPATTSAAAFDVISVKQNKSGSGGMRMTGVTDSFQGNNITVDDLVFNSYNLTSNDLIFGLPGWARSAHFDVDAKVVNPDKKQMDSLTPEHRKAMLFVIL